MKARTSEGDAVGRGGLSCGMRDCFSGVVGKLLMVDVPRRCTGCLTRRWRLGFYTLLLDVD